MTSAEWLKQAILAECYHRAAITAGAVAEAQYLKELAIYSLAKCLEAIAIQMQTDAAADALIAAREKQQ